MQDVFFAQSVTAASFPPPPKSTPKLKSIASTLPSLKFSIFNSRHAESRRSPHTEVPELHITRRETWTAPANLSSPTSNSHHPSISQVLHAPAPSQSTVTTVEPTYYRMELQEEETIKIEEQHQWTKELSEYSSENTSPRSSIGSEESMGDIGTLVDLYIDGGDSTAEDSEDEDVYDKQMKRWDESLWGRQERAIAEEEVLVVDWETFV